MHQITPKPSPTSTGSFRTVLKSLGKSAFLSQKGFFNFFEKFTSPSKKWVLQPILAMLLLLVAIPAIQAQEANFISTPVAPTVNVGDPIVVTISVDIISGSVNGAEAHMNFDTGLLQVTNLNFLGGAELPVPLVTPVFDNTVGTIDFGYGTFSSFPTSDFDLIEITFNTLGTGSTQLTYNTTVPPVSDITGGGISILGTANPIPITINGTDLPPVVSITSPADNANFVAGTNVAITADATDDVGVSQVELYIDGIATGQIDTAAPYEFSINNIAQGSFVLTAVATDGVNAPVTSDPINISADPPVDNPPLVSITSPADGATFSEGDNVTVVVSASDDIGVTGVELFNGAVSLGVDNTAPYEFALNNIAAGVYNLTAEASDINTSTTSSQVNITVSVPDTAPVITLAGTASVAEGGSVSVPLSIADADGDALIVTITTLSNEPNELQSNQDPGGIQREPYPFDANAFFAETGVTNNPGAYASSLDF